MALRSESEIRATIESLTDQLDEAEKDVARLGKEYSRAYDQADQNITRSWKRMHNFPKIKKALPMVAFGALGIGMGALGGMANTLGSPVAMTIFGGVALLSGATVAGSIYANEKLKFELSPVGGLTRVERAYYDALSAKDELPRSTGFGKALARHSRLGEQLKAAHAELTQLQTVSQEIKDLADRALREYEEGLEYLENEVSVGDVSVERK